MDLKMLAIVAALVVVIYAPPSQEKPLSLVERCYCRAVARNVPRSLVREIRFISTPNCPLQVIARLKSRKEVCINPESRLVQLYLRNALNRMKQSQYDN